MWLRLTQTQIAQDTLSANYAFIDVGISQILFDVYQAIIKQEMPYLHLAGYLITNDGKEIQKFEAIRNELLAHREKLNEVNEQIRKRLDSLVIIE